ncbi:MAG: diiron oxygenase [Gammaproteobacteria bacterium]
MMLQPRDMDTVVSTLCRVSQDQFADPFQALDWPESLDKAQWYFSPELVSIYGMPEYDALPEDQKELLSFYETVNFFSLNIHGEKALIEGLARNLYVRENPAISPYLHHFLDEENKHMIYFGRFCTYYAGKIYPDKKMLFPREYAPGEEEVLFFIKVMIFEEIVDVYNTSMATDERLVPIAREINRLHHVDESRHLAFGRAIVKWLFEHYSGRWSEATLAAVREYVTGYLLSTWREYYNVDVYRDVGLQDPYGLQERAFARPGARVHRKRVSDQCIRYLMQSKILLEEPAL